MGPVVTFWKWLFSAGPNGYRGIDNVIDGWLFFHVLVGLLFAHFVDVSSSYLASRLVLPSSAILIGFSFAWAGRSSSIFQDKGFSKFLIDFAPPVEDYIYAFQLAVLVCIAYLVAYIVIASGGFPLTTGNCQIDNFINLFILFSVGSLTLRECWGVVNFVNLLTLQFYIVRRRELEDEKLDEG